MQNDTSARTALTELLKSCKACTEYYCSNVPLISDDEGNLTDAQVEIVAVHVHEYHQVNHVVH